MSASHDVIVIGSGAGGGAAAYGLSKAGMKVLLLEQGKRYDRTVDYPLDRNDWDTVEHFESENPDTYVHEPYRLESTQYPFVSRRQGMPMGKPFGQFLYARATGLGGTTLRFQAESHRFSPHAFSMKHSFGLGRNWPVSYEVLERHYQEAERLLGVAGNRDNPFKPGREKFPLPAHPFGCASLTVQKGAGKLGLSVIENSLAIPSRPYRGRPRCIYCRGCSNGCVIGDKGSADVALIEPAMSTGNLDVRTRAKALSIELDAQGLASAVVWKGPEGTVRSEARYVVVSCGAIETPRLLLNCTSPAFPDGLLNTHGNVGAGLMTSLSVGLLGFFDRPMKTYAGLPMDSKIWDYSSPENIRKHGGPFGIAVLNSLDGLSSPAGFAAMLAPGWGSAHKEYMRRYFGSHAMLFGVADHMPRDENRVTLDEEKDADGIAKARVHMAFNGDDFKMLKVMLDKCTELADASGMAIEAQFSSLDTILASHVGGTTRMGMNRRDSVVNEFCRAHEVKNLYIADASVLVTQGCGDSPSLTISALALRAAEHIVASAR